MDCEKFKMLGLKLTDSKSKCFDLKRKRALQQSSEQCNNQADKPLETEYRTPCSFIMALNLVLNTYTANKAFNLAYII